MHRFAAILLSFLSAVTVIAQNDALEDINAEVTETVTEPEYNFKPDADSPDVEVAPLAVNKQDQDVPLKPTVTEDITISTDSTQKEND